MKRVHIIILLTSLSIIAGENLVKNGSLDNGKLLPTHWEKANGLTTFYIKEKGRGRVAKLDTRVSRKQALAWMKEFKKDPTKKAPKPKFLKAGSFATIGAVEGVMLDSEFIKAKPGQNYKLSVDIKCKGKPIVWIKGFLYHPRRKDYADAYQTRLVPEKASKTEWRRFSIGFNPTKRIKKIEKFKVRLYAYWPSAIYYFDNIKVEEITQKEMEELVKKRSIVPTKKPKKK